SNILMTLGCLFKGLSEEAFREKFGTGKQCLEFLAAEKWKNGYKCLKCGNDNYCKGRTPFSRRCTRCKHDESPTSHTIFHRCRIPLPSAFEIAYKVCCAPEITSTELAETMETRQMTCWKFRTKIRECLKRKRGLIG
ncbi:MAG: transposase, partial [Bacteroidota bacterium]|nr:transposase [Bacteroidota bacterium]